MPRVGGEQNAAKILLVFSDLSLITLRRRRAEDIKAEVSTEAKIHYLYLFVSV